MIEDLNHFATALLLIFVIFFTLSGVGQSDSMPKKKRNSTLFDSLYNLPIEHVEIHVDLDSLIAGKLTNNKHSAKMKVVSVSGDSMELPLQISVRSRSRRRYCDFPPLKFDFVKGDLKDMGLKKQDDYKIVTHCLDKKVGEQVLLKEYLVYQLYQIITSMTLRAKLVDMVYVNTNDDSRVEKKAIILESDKEFAKKHDGKLCECMGTAKDSIDAFLFEQLAMFQYMIGNSDMNYLVERNVKFVRQAPDVSMIPVAYDFDFSALVNAPYVHPRVRDNRTLKRVYMGFRENAHLLPEVKKVFLDKKEDVLSYVESFDLIPKFEKRLCLQYIKNFYRTISNSRFELPYVETL